MAKPDKKPKHRFPDTVYLTVSGPANQPYFSVMREGLESIGTDGTIVGMYKLKRVSRVRVSRKLIRED